MVKSFELPDEAFIWLDSVMTHAKGVISVTVRVRDGELRIHYLDQRGLAKTAKHQLLTLVKS